MQQWIRKFSLILGSGSDALDVSLLRCTFTIKKTSAQTPNEAEIKVYNLSSGTAAQIQREFTRVILQAGYESNYAVIFDGTTKQIKTGRENGTDTYLQIMASDGDAAYNFAVVNTTLAAGSSSSDHINAAGGAMGAHGVTTGHIGDVGGQKLTRGKVMFGSSKDYLRQSAQNSDADWSIQDGKLQIVPIRGLLPTQAVVLTSKTGLIGSPEQTNDGIQAKTLLNPMLKIGGKVIIDNKSVEMATISENKSSKSGDKKQPADKPATIAADGAYKIIKIEYNGDTRGTDWYCDIVCIDIDETIQEAKNG
jgi:hypothetical protein